ncbi:M56 family metallopeptidase [Chitinophaga sancti]|uniref:M56 family metallopeptidase n=1 Tax=Chitinophaga sancti TaxID=1004 RepID=UPI002A75D9FD|nr:M56 family metallopeptidase [Chitinophaga sancti]WPQ62076.1 M56 family metallopeptidase [Chitinophaga sancti]
MTAQFVLPTILIQAFGWALLHSLWQGFLIFACLRLVLYVWSHMSARIKYNLSYLSLTGIFAWFCITLYQQVTAALRIRQATWVMIETGVRQRHLEVPPIYQSQSTIKHFIPQLEMWFPVLVGLYVTGVAVMSIKLIMDLVQLKQIRNKQVLPIDAVWEKHLERLAARLRIPRKVQLLISTQIQVPVMIGFLKPLILLPVAMFNNLTTEQLEAILLHELAHIKRNDYLLNIFQSIVETILFFNPFIWWITKNIRLEREHCCDDLVIASQVQPLQYAKALVALEEYRLTVNALAMAAADNKQHLFHRIKRIMEMKTKNINYTQKLLAVLIIAVSLVAIAWLNPIQARAKKTASKSPAPVLTKISRTLLGDTTAPKGNVHTEKQKQDEFDLEALDADVQAATDDAMANINWEDVNNDVANAMKEVNWEDINREVENAMKNIDWKQINKDVDNAMKEIDWKQIKKEVKESLRQANVNAHTGVNVNPNINFNPDVNINIDTNVIQESIRVGMDAARTAMKDVAIPAAKMGMDAARAAMNSQEFKAAMDKGRQEAAKAMKESRKQMEFAMATAKAEMKKQRVAETKMREDMAHAKADGQYKEMIDKMAADKLIDADKGYKIEKKDGDLYINDVKQSGEVTDKYKIYLKNAKKLSIVGKEDSLSINVEE